MMVNQTQLFLHALNSGEFEQLISKLLPRISKKLKNLVHGGAVEGTAKTRVGTPDIWIVDEENTLICIEITVDKYKKKLIKDLDKCILYYNKDQLK